MLKNQYTKLIKNVFSSDKDFINYFPVWDITDKVSLSVLWVLNNREKDLLEKYIDFKRWKIASLDAWESKEAKQIWIKLLRVISSFYDKIQDKARFNDWDFFYEKEKLYDKIKRNFNNPWLALEYFLLSNILDNPNNESFYLAPVELENKQVDFLSRQKTSKVLKSSKNKIDYSPSYNIAWQLTVSSNAKTIKDKLIWIEKLISKIDLDDDREIKLLKKSDKPEVPSLLIINWDLSNFVQSQTRLTKSENNILKKH